MDVYEAGISVKVSAHYPGRSPCVSPTMASVKDYRNGDVAGRAVRAAARAKGRDTEAGGKRDASIGHPHGD